MAKQLLCGLVFILFANHALQAQIGLSDIGRGTMLPDSVGYIAIGKAETQKCTFPAPCGSSCSVYTFIGAGEWNIEGNWEGGFVPPAVLTGCFEIIINPAADAECILNISMQMLPPGASLRVMEGKRFRIPGSVIIQDQ